MPTWYKVEKQNQSLLLYNLPRLYIWHIPLNFSLKSAPCRIKAFLLFLCRRRPEFEIFPLRKQSCYILELYKDILKQLKILQGYCVPLLWIGSVIDCRYIIKNVIWITTCRYWFLDKICWDVIRNLNGKNKNHTVKTIGWLLQWQTDWSHKSCSTVCSCIIWLNQNESLFWLDYFSNSGSVEKEHSKR